ELLVPADELPDGWRDALAEIARRTYAVLFGHPWVSELHPDEQNGPNALRHIEQCLTVASRTGLDAEQQLELILFVDDYVFGCVGRTGQLRDGELDPDFAAKLAAVVAYYDAQLETGEYPRLQALAGDDTRAAFDRFGKIAADGQRFERGLQRL